MQIPRTISQTLLAAAISVLPMVAGATTYPLQVQNCGYTVSYDKAPASAVTIGQAGTEMLYALGLGDKVVGTSLWFNAVQPQFKAINDKVPRLADNDPSFESVIGKRPGLVVSQFEWMVGKDGVVGTREQFHDLRIATYAMPSDCEGKNNLSGADGTRTAAYDVNALYKSVRQLAQIFDVQTRGEALVKDLMDRQAKAVAKVKASNMHNLSAALWFSSADLAIDPYMAGQKGVAGYMMQTLGLRNIVTSAEEWPTVGWETIAKANPSILVIARMDRRRFPADDYQKKLEFLKSDPVTQHMDAVKNNRIVIVDADALQGSIRMVTGMEQISDAVLKLQTTAK
ncbi:ABC transporter substrate-binding protein (plasmid) [Diaphorobacter sp. HDW4B]|uniref:ABC transporter substrate-binding protein n=1 Tax=Diaphorobacter sp. HDW4B TaxID=2714925 RepID=UPI00140934C8|nr:ABC transporter substrate-binding protein [Diaphorobacter sp. HDW4B]QIL73782.1 ABC transporter substrate-binding protein [Diaphorobacter sp. HDW4B]